MGAASPHTTIDRAAQLHSRYNPRAEADRYIDALGIKDSAEYFILIESGLGYLVESLKKRFPGRKIIVLHADSELRHLVRESDDVPAWYPDSPRSAQWFLENEIPDTPSRAIQIIEWRPALNIYGKAYRAILGEAVDFVKRADAAYRTAQNFGSRWVKNFFRNLEFINKIMLFRPADTPVLITGSGPTLEAALPRIRAMAGGALVMASSSSAAALRQGEISADLLITTDGGSWALSHLYSCFRVTPANAGIAVNLCAALPSQSARHPFLILNDGSLWQTLVLSELGIPSLIVPQRGTVTASALELALVLSRGAIYLAGVDLALRDIQTHARPYAFDHLFYGSSFRTRPLYSQYFSRARDTSGGGSLDIYAAWFKDRLKTWPKRIFALEKHNAVFETSPDIENRAGRKEFFVTQTPPGDPRAYRERALAVLVRALETSDFADTVSKELGALLFPGERCPGTEEIKSELKHIAARGGEKKYG